MEEISSGATELLFESFPSPERTLERFDVLAKMYGVPAFEIEEARVLELGCGRGGNIFPQALRFRAAKFLGVDHSPKQIELAESDRQELGLSNVTFQVSDLEKFESQHKYDFIICHGLFSWVAAEIRRQILQITRDCLSESGVAYISYNVLPGWEGRAKLRESLLSKDDKSLALKKRIGRARELMEQRAEELAGDLSADALAERGELQQCLSQSDAFVLHELLESECKAFYFRDFVLQAEKRGLQYLGDGSPLRMRATRAILQGRADPECDKIKTEGEYDFRYPVSLRGALLCRRELTLNSSPDPSAIKSFFISSTLIPERRKPQIHARTEVEFRAPDGASLFYEDPLFKGAFVYLRSSWPEAIGLDELVAGAQGLAFDKPEDSLEVEPLLEELLKLYFEGYVEFHLKPIGCERFLVDNLEVFTYAKIQGRRQNWVTTLRHEFFPLNEFARMVVPFLNGGHTSTSMVNHLLELVKEGVITPAVEGKAIEDPDELKEIVESSLEATITSFREAALLVETSATKD